MKERYRVRLTLDRSNFATTTFTTIVTIDESDPFTDVSDIAHDRCHEKFPYCEVTGDEEIVAL